MTNREAHPDYASYPVGMRVTRIQRAIEEETTNRPAGLNRGE